MDVERMVSSSVSGGVVSSPFCPPAPEGDDAGSVLGRLRRVEQPANGWLSPDFVWHWSTISAFRKCPAAFATRWLLRVDDPPGWHSISGTLAHRVLQRFYEYPPDLRTAHRLADAAQTTWAVFRQEPEWQQFVTGQDGFDEAHFLEYTWDAIDGIWACERPDKVNVLRLEPKLKATVMSAQRTFRMEGTPDRVDLVGGDNWETDAVGVRIVDYKTGKTAPPSRRDQVFEQLQAYGVLWTMLYPSSFWPVELRLLYPREGKVFTRSFDAQESWLMLQRRVSTVVEAVGRGVGKLRTKTGPLCDYCSYQADCPPGLSWKRR